MPVNVNIYKQMLDNCAKDMQHDFDKTMLAKKPNMKEIHKTEILEKLALGWKVRRKCWKDGVFLERTQSIDTLVRYSQYDDWEAESPTPVMKCVHSGLWLEDAVRLIRHDKRRLMRSISADGSYFHTIGWHNYDELWNLDDADNMKPVSPAIFHGDDDMFRKNSWIVCVLE